MVGDTSWHQVCSSLIRWLWTSPMCADEVQSTIPDGFIARAASVRFAKLTIRHVPAREMLVR